MLFDELEVAVILVGVVLLDTRWQAADDNELAVVIPHSTRTMHDLGHSIPSQFGEITCGVDIHPRIGLACRFVELPQVHGHIDLPVVIAQVAVVKCHGDSLDRPAVSVSLHQEGREAPENGVLFVRTDSL